MKLILGKRGSGKTTRLIDECSKDDDGYMVCLSELSARTAEITAKINSEELKARPLTHLDMIHPGVSSRFKGRSEMALYVDDGEALIHDLMRPLLQPEAPISAIVIDNDMIDHWNDRLSKIDVVTENGRHRRIEISIKEFEEG